MGWGLFVIASLVYLLTMERTLSFWDCGEYIVSSAKLGVTHAPGAAMYQLIGAVWAGLSFGDNSLYSILINSMSAMFSAGTILFLFWTITHFGQRIVVKEFGEKMPMNKEWVVLLAGVIGSLAFMFSDSFWFSAVEGEVYAMASFFTALLLWLALKWENEIGEPRENRWLILIALIVGMSTGVHLMAILVVPAICYIYYFKHYEFSWKGFAIANVITLAIFYFVFQVVFSTIMNFFGNIEIFMVNELDMPFHTGTLVAFLLLVVVFYFALFFTRKKGWVTANTAVLAVMFMLIGFSSWLVIPIRANANPHMNLNDPDDAIGLLDYFNREQYGDWPVFNGPLYTAHISPNGVERNPDGSYKMRDRGPIYKRNVQKGTYDVVGRKSDYVYNSDHIGPFARMYHPQAVENYKAIMGEPETVTMYNPERQEMEPTYVKPGLFKNIQFFLSYQVGYMYLRYLGWNFIGRQNDLEGNMEVTRGNMITGITFIDNLLIGGQTNLPAIYKDTAARNVYFALPFILGIVGFFFQAKRDPGRTFALVSLFLLTGVGIILYTNVRPFEPRERDYAVVSSFYVFAIWLGLGAMSVYYFLKTKMAQKKALIVTAILLAIPLWMGFQNWDDHDRSQRRAAHDLAHNYLVNLDPNSIIFVYGDNDTYPLWGLQETELFRDDVKIVNYTLLGSTWNISQAKRRTYNAAPIPGMMQEEDYRQGVNEGIIVLSQDLMTQIEAYAAQNEPQLHAHVLSLKQYVENGMTAKEAMEWILDRNNPAKQALVRELKMVYSSSIDNVLPTNKIIVPVNRENALKNGIISQSQAGEMVPNVVFNIKKNQIGYKSELVMLDLLANYNWDRAIYFSSGGMYDDTNIFYLNDYLQYEGFSFKFVPIRTERSSVGDIGTLDADRMYGFVKNLQWANFGKPNVHFDPTSTNNILTYRSMVSRTANKLIEQGDTEKAREILQILDENIPYERFSEGVTLFSLVPTYLRLGETQKAEELQSFLKQQNEELLNYYNGLTASQRISVANEIQRQVGVQQYSTANMIDYYLAVEKDTIAAKNEFEKFYLPIERRIEQIANRVQAVGINSLTEEEHQQLGTDLGLQRSMLPYANDIDSAYAAEKFRSMLETMERIDPRGN